MCLTITTITTLILRQNLSTLRKSIRSMKDISRTNVAISTIRTFISLRSTLIRRKLRLTDMPLKRPRRRLINKRNTSRVNATTLDVRDPDMSTTPRLTPKKSPLKRKRLLPLEKS
jgi:hypothetical protein